MTILIDKKYIKKKNKAMLFEFFFSEQIFSCTLFFSEPFFYSFVVIMFLVWSRHRKNQFQQRMIKSRSYSQSNIDQEKIILAIEIKNLIIQTSDKKLNGYEELKIQQHQHQSGLINKVKKMFGYGAYYKLMFQKNKIKAFFKTLRQLENIQIYLYTSLSKNFSQAILKKLQLNEYLPAFNCRYSQQQQSKVHQRKNPIWIDNNTRRVIIMTANKQDFNQEDKKYFLVLNRLKKDRLLKSSLSLIKQIVNRVKCVDELHNQMDEIKAQIETENQIQEGQEMTKAN